MKKKTYAITKKIFILFCGLLFLVYIYFNNTSINDLTKKADSGDQFAQMELASLYYNGQGVVPQDYKKAFEYYKLAAKQGHPNAQWNLAYMYELGEGISQYYTKAF